MENNPNNPEAEGNFGVPSPDASFPVPPPPPQQYYAHQVPNGRPTESSAILALVLGVVSILSCQFIGIAAIIVGQNSLKKIRASNGSYEGEGMAKAGVILGWISIGIFIAVIALYAIMFLAFGASAFLSS